MRYRKRSAIADGRLMKNGSIQYSPGVFEIVLIPVRYC
jgi:hypothetical protein